MKLNYTALLNFSKELTIKAIENGLIMKYDNAIDTAKEVVDFYKEVKSTLNSED